MALVACLLAVAVLIGLKATSGARSSADDAPGAVDIGYAQFMTIHHDQAVTMSQILLARGNSRLSGLANAILMNQLLEMGQMRGWLAAWHQPLVPQSRQMDWMLAAKTPPDAAILRYRSDCRAAPGGMPNLATADELNRLTSLEGDERDRLFLELMIRHHEGALPMARFAAQNADTPLVRGQASLTVLEQSREIDSMKLLLQQTDSGRARL